MTATDTTTEHDVVTWIDVDLIDPDPENRHDAPTDAMVESVRERGVETAVAVRAMDTGRYELIYGEQRWQSAKIAGLAKICAVIKVPVDDADRIEMQGVENLHRKDLHPLDEGKLFARLRLAGRTQQQIADRFADGQQPYVSKRMNLHLRLNDDAQQLFRDGHLNVKEAEALAQLHDRPDVVTELLDIARETEPGPAPHIPEFKVRKALEDHQRAKTIDAAHKKLTKAGVRILTFDEWSSDTVHVIGNEEIFDVDVDPALHANEPCHAASVDAHSGHITDCCTDIDRHRPAGDSALKASNLHDLNDEPDDDDSTATAAADSHPPEDDADPAPAKRCTVCGARWSKTYGEPMSCGTHGGWNKDTRAPAPTADAEPARVPDALDGSVVLDAAKASRLAAMQATVRGTRSQAYANELLRTQLLASPLVDEFSASIGAILGSGTSPWPAESVRTYVANGGDNPTRFVLALALALGEHALTSCLRYGDVDEVDRPAIAAHLKTLSEHGHTIEAFEGEMLEEHDDADDDDVSAPAASCDICHGASYRGAVLHMHRKGPTTFSRAACSCPTRTKSIEDDPCSPGQAGYGTGPWFTPDPDDPSILIGHTPPWLSPFTRDGLCVAPECTEHSGCVRQLCSTHSSDPACHHGVFDAWEAIVAGDKIDEERLNDPGWCKEDVRLPALVQIAAARVRLAIAEALKTRAVGTKDQGPTFDAANDRCHDLADLLVSFSPDPAALGERLDEIAEFGLLDLDGVTDDELWTRSAAHRGNLLVHALRDHGAPIDDDMRARIVWDGEWQVGPKSTHTVARFHIHDIAEAARQRATTFDANTSVDETVVGAGIAGAYTGKGLTRVRLEALRVLAFADATDAFSDVRLSTSSTGWFEGDDVELVVLSQAAGWLIDNGLAERTAPKSARITDVGRKVARDEDVLAGIALPETAASTAPAALTGIDAQVQDLDSAMHAAMADAGVTKEELDAEFVEQIRAEPGDTPDGDPLPAVVAGFIAAREALEASNKTKKKDRPTFVGRYEDARTALASTLVLRHPNREELVGGLQAIVDADPERGAQSDVLIGDLLDLLEQGGRIEAIELLRVEKRPATRVAGLLRHVYVEDLLDAVEDLGGIDLAAVSDWQATNWPDMADVDDVAAAAYFEEHHAEWGTDGARIAYLIERANAGVAWNHRTKLLIAIRSRIAARKP